MSRKILITGGCSFSDSHDNLKTWNTYLEDMYDEIHHTGKDGIGNQYISRLVSYKLITIDKEDADVDVIVMWSGIHRKLYTSNKDQYLNADVMLHKAFEQFNHITKDWRYNSENDKEMLKDTNAGQHQDLEDNVINEKLFAYDYFLPTLKHKKIEDFYLKYTNEVDDWEQSAFTIFNLQELCRANNANFYYTHYDNHFADLQHNLIRTKYNHLSWAINNVDRNNCFCNEGMTDWVKQNFVTANGFTSDGYHPSQAAHKAFAKSVIKPFLELKK